MPQRGRRYTESVARTLYMEMAKVAGAVYKVGNSALVNTEIFERYLERFREPAVPLPKHIVDKEKMMGSKKSD